MKAFNNQNFLVLDDDPVVLKMTESYLNALDAERVYLFEDIEEAWECATANIIDAFILDWQIANASSTGIFNRIRLNKKTRHTPIILISGQIEKNDQTLIDEFPCSAFLKKPFTAALVTNLLRRLAQESKQLEKYQELINRFMRLSYEDGERALDNFRKILKKIPDQKYLQILGARTFRENRHFEQALIITEEMLAKEPSSIPALTELSKIYYEMGKFEVCLKHLDKISTISPKNVERILLAGKAHSQNFEFEQAETKFKQALEIDPQQRVAKIGVKTCKSMNSYLQKHSEKGVPGNLASLLNIIGVNMVRSNDASAAIDQYLSAFEFAGSPADRARVAFNLGLGYLREKDSSQAADWFHRSQKIDPICSIAASKHLKKLESSQTATEEIALEEDEIFGGFFEEQAKPKSEKKPKKTPEEEDFDAFLDEFDIDDL
ncbi:response regulator [Oligoflexaceae bacterium]|nr:response regulator [Oligoflexaceae bacterium]